MTNIAGQNWQIYYYMCSFIWCFYWMFFSSIKEINRLISKGMSNICYWEKLWFSKLLFFLERKFEEMHWLWRGARYIQGNIYFGIIAFICLLPTKLCPRLLLICFAWGIKGFYQNSLGNVIAFDRDNEPFPKYLG